MAIEDQDQQHSLIRSSLLWRRPEASAHGELVWDADVATVKPSSTEAPAAPTIEDVVVTEPRAPESAADGLAAEIAQRRADELERLDAELNVRRAELARSLERQGAEAEERIATAERLEREAMAHWHTQADRLGAAERPRTLAERLDGALASELAQVRRRREHAEARLRQQLEARRREEMARLEAWRVSERERVEAELAAEERRFNERLTRQLQEFEFQLGERLREQEERLAHWWDEAEKVVRQRLACLLEEAFSAEASARDETTG